MNRNLIVPVMLLLILPACRGDEASPASARPLPVSPADGAIAPLAAHRAGESVADAGGNAATVTAASLRLELPAGWTSRPPASTMRAAQISVPGGDGEGELVLFYFGPGQGGGVEANFERWQGQMEADPRINPERGAFEANGFRISWIEVRGTLLPSTMGSGPSSPQAGSRLFGAVVEGDGGPWFFKLTGPDATIAAAREPFLAMLRGLRRG